MRSRRPLSLCLRLYQCLEGEVPQFEARIQQAVRLVSLVRWQTALFLGNLLRNRRDNPASGLSRTGKGVTPSRRT